MVNLKCHAAWAPEDGLWSPWVKPILFAQMADVAEPADDPLAQPSGALPSTPGAASSPAAGPAADTAGASAPTAVHAAAAETPRDASPASSPQPVVPATPVGEAALLGVPGLPAMTLRDALVLDLPGEETMDLAFVFARRGFRPVPLFNGTSGPMPVVDVHRVMRALQRGTVALRSIPLRPDSPPAFLLDSLRSGGTLTVGPGRYDNRWVVLPQDMPSGNFLASHGISHVTLVRRGGLQPAADLAHILLRWQEQGLRLSVVDLDARQAGHDVKVSRPSLFRSTWYAAITLLGLRRSNMGGFGAAIPQQVAQSGWYA